jgi:tellurite resistance protein TerC
VLQTTDFHPQFLAGFFVLIAILLVLDLGVFNRKAHSITMRASLFLTGFWISLALAFNVAVWWILGKSAALTFLTAYVVELSLSVDNLFVFILIFTSFRIPSEHQHRVLFWGIIGALVMRAICILAGVEALARFEWLTYIFGAILIYSGIKTLREDDEEGDPSQGVAARLVRRLIPVTNNFDGSKFFTREGGVFKATPLFLALIIVELSDVIFAIDSIPAVLAITRDPFLVYTSNIFAILGLRSIYFALAHMVRLFHYLNYALSFILLFVGAKIMLAHFYKVPVGIALGVIITALASAVIASLIFTKKEQGTEA